MHACSRRVRAVARRPPARLMGTEMWRPKRRLDEKWFVEHPRHLKRGADLARNAAVTNRMTRVVESWEADARASLLAHDTDTARIVLAEMKYLDVVGTRETFRCVSPSLSASPSSLPLRLSVSLPLCPSPSRRLPAFLCLP